jgi:branched-chain amino acid transport system permease protein
MNIKHSFLDAFVAAILATIVFGPIMGIVLDGYSFNLDVPRVAIIVGIIFVGRFVFQLTISTQGGRDFFQQFEKGRAGSIEVTDPGIKTVLAKAIPFIMLAAAILPFFIGKYWITILILAYIYILLGLGLNIVVGLAGLLDLGFVAFYAIGAYGLALGSEYLGIGFWIALPMSAILAASFGAILGFPVLRMHGDYLAIVTLGFGEIIRLVLNNWSAFTHGPNGASAPPATLFNLEFKRTAAEGYTPFHEFFNIDYNSTHRYIFIYLLVLIAVAFALRLKHRLVKMPIGRAWEALRENEIACRSLGMNHVTIKLSAFMMGAAIAGVAGVFFAAKDGFVNPASFSFIESALILAIVVLGGLGSTVGVVIAALLVILIPEVMREFSEYRYLVFGLLMVIMMIIRPRGLITIKRDRKFSTKGEGAVVETKQGEGAA